MDRGMTVVTDRQIVQAQGGGIHGVSVQRPGHGQPKPGHQNDRRQQPLRGAAGQQTPGRKPPHRANSKAATVPSSPPVASSRSRGRQAGGCKPVMLTVMPSNGGQHRGELVAAFELMGVGDGSVNSR